jgi:type II secretory pathway component PulF
MGFEGGDVSTDLGEVPDSTKSVVLTPAEPESKGLRVVHLMVAVVVCGLLVWLGMALKLWLVVFAIFGLMMGAVGLGVVVVRRGTLQQESLLWALAIAAERELPLAPAALAFADQFAGAFRARVYHLAALLTEGVPLPDAVDQVPGLLAPEAELLVHVGWETGTLPHALRQAAVSRAARQAAWGPIIGRFGYLAVALIHIQGVIFFISYFIAPKFEAIFKDFGVSLPEVTVATANVTHFFARYFPVLLLVLLLETLFLACLPLALFGLLRWELPFFSALFRRRHATLILRALALTAEGRKPILAGIATLSQAYPARWVRRRLVEVRRDVERGGDWVESLGDHGLIRPSDEAVLTSAQRAGNLGWALAELAEANERRLGYRLQLWLQLLFPALVFALGLLVFVMAVAYFSPIVKLIEVLSG